VALDGAATVSLGDAVADAADTVRATAVCTSEKASSCEVAWSVAQPVIREASSGRAETRIA
jgi:hypothetical protein